MEYYIQLSIGIILLLLGLVCTVLCLSGIAAHQGYMAIAGVGFGYLLCRAAVKEHKDQKAL